MASCKMQPVLGLPKPSEANSPRSRHAMHHEKAKEDGVKRTRGKKQKTEKVQANSHLQPVEEPKGANRDGNPGSRPFVDTNILNNRYVDSSNVPRHDGISLVRAFMFDRNMSEACQAVADKVDEFCGLAGLDDCPPDHTVFLVDDRCCFPGREGVRPNPGPLTPQSYLEHRSQPVSRKDIKSIIGMTTNPASSSVSKVGLANAKRRQVTKPWQRAHLQIVANSQPRRLLTRL